MIAPGGTIGILGGGQLGRMLAIAAAELGYHAHIYTPEQDAPAAEVAETTIIAAYNDAEALARFAQHVDVVTYEFENIPLTPVEALAKQVMVYPAPTILMQSQHRILEKSLLNHLGIATAPYRGVSSLQELQQAVGELGLPCVLKTCRMGYDGKGQMMLKEATDVERAWQHLSPSPLQVEHPLILEGFIRFQMEISVIIARAQDGAMASYCPVRNIHSHHILSETIAPAPITPALAAEAERIARTIATGLDLVGLMAIEMFVTDSGEILVNELAPRPHNSGHWTIDACVTSQFAQTIRAICGLPLGSTARLCDARMVNLIGDDVKDWQKHLDDPNAKLHLYGKKEARPGRKMGHVTVLRLPVASGQLPG